MIQIEKNIEELRKTYGGKAKSIRNPKLPIKFSPTLCRIIGHVIGDGEIRQNYSVHYTNQSKFLTRQFEQDVIKVFGDMKAYEYYNKDDKTHNVVFPSIVGLILVTFIGQMVRSSKHIPDKIFHLDKQNKRLFLRALFDDESSVSVSKHTIEFSMTNKIIVEDVREILREFDIRPDKSQKKMESHHKKEKLRRLIRNY